MAHAQKPDLVFQRNGRVHLNWRGGQFSRLLAAEVCASAVVMVVMLDTPCSEVECKTTGYPLHSHVSPSLPPPVRHRVPSGSERAIPCILDSSGNDATEITLRLQRIVMKIIVMLQSIHIFFYSSSLMRFD